MLLRGKEGGDGRGTTGIAAALGLAAKLANSCRGSGKRDVSMVGLRRAGRQASGWADRQATPVGRLEGGQTDSLPCYSTNQHRPRAFPFKCPP